jgi:hypothetical protein
MAQIFIKKTSDGQPKAVEGEDTGELRVVICGKTSEGVVTPILVDETGHILFGT